MIEDLLSNMRNIHGKQNENEKLINTMNLSIVR